MPDAYDALAHKIVTACSGSVMGGMIHLPDVIARTLRAEAAKGTMLAHGILERCNGADDDDAKLDMIEGICRSFLSGGSP